MAKWNELSAEQLKYNCNISSFDFETTENLEPITDVVGQERAVKAVQFGLFNKSNGYNIYISGLVGTGKRTYAQKTVKLIWVKEHQVQFQQKMPFWMLRISKVRIRI